jgi:hypothetical protein
MADTPAETTPTRRSRRGLRVIDIVAATVILAVIVVLCMTLVSKLQLKHEVSTARVVADRTLHDIVSVNAKDARSLGDAQFQVAHSTTQLQNLFKNASVYAKGSPELERQIVDNGSAGQAVTFVYRYGQAKPYYFQIIVSKSDQTNGWRLTGISGSSTVTALDVH